MDRYTIHPHRWTRMQDTGLARSEFVASVELARRSHAGDPQTPDGQIIARFIRLLAAEFAAAWAAARARRQALKALKRVDRRLLRDIGIERGRLREVVDAMAAAQAQAGDAARPPRRATVDGAWLKAHPAS